MLARVATLLATAAERYVPSAFAIAVLLTGVTLGILVGVHYLETSFKSLRRGVHNRLEHWRNGNERGVSASPRQEELGSGLEK